jgi:Na+/melibiose symporter-like transporter
MTDQPRRLSVGVMCAYGIGELAQAAMTIGFNMLLLFFYQQIVGVSGTLTGLALAIAMVFDAVTDPIAGGMSDRLQSRFGRRHPMMALAAIPLAISFIALFSPPAGLSELQGFLWLTVFAVLVRGSMTFYHIPHLALGAEMAAGYRQRSTLFAVSTVILFAGSSVLAIAVYWVFFPTTEAFTPGLLNPAGYPTYAMAAAVLMVMSLAVCLFGTAGEIPYLRAPEETGRLSIRNLVRDMREVFVDRDLVVIFAGFILFSLVAAIEGVGQPFIGMHFWGLPTEKLGFLPIAAIAAFPLAMVLVPLATRYLDKKYTLIVGALAVIVPPNIIICLRLVGWYPDNGSPWVLANWMIAVFCVATLAVVMAATYNSIFADLADAHELRTGKRREGAIYAARAFANKAAGALGLVVGGIILDLIAFPKQAILGTVPDDIIWNLGFFVGPATSVFSIASLFFFWFYRIDQRRHAEIIAQLAARKEAAVATPEPSSEQEVAD